MRTNVIQTSVRNERKKTMWWKIRKSVSSMDFAAMRVGMFTALVLWYCVLFC